MNDTLAGMILTALDNQFEKAKKETGLWSFVKTALIGITQGLIDGAVIVGGAFSLWGLWLAIFKKRH